MIVTHAGFRSVGIYCNRKYEQKKIFAFHPIRLSTWYSTRQNITETRMNFNEPLNEFVIYIYDSACQISDGIPQFTCTVKWPLSVATCSICYYKPIALIYLKKNGLHQHEPMNLRNFGRFEQSRLYGKSHFSWSEL